MKRERQKFRALPSRQPGHETLFDFKTFAFAVMGCRRYFLGRVKSIFGFEDLINPEFFTNINN